MTAEQEAALATCVAEHADQLQHLLGPLWPARPWKVEQFGPLTKYTLGPMPSGEWAMLHRLTEPDTGPPHCHPVAFESTILAGGYWERLYEHGTVREVWRAPGATHAIAPDCIHKIVGLPAGACWSLCFAGPVVRQWRHYPELEPAAS